MIGKLLEKVFLGGTPSYDEPLDLKKIRYFNEKVSLSDFMTYQFYSEKDKLYETLTGCGFILEVAIPEYLGNKNAVDFEILLKETYPPDTVITFFSFASENIDPILDFYLQNHMHRPKVKHPEVLEEIVKSRVEYLKKASRSSLWSDMQARPRWIKNYLSVFMPWGNDLNKSWNTAKNIARRTRALLSNSGYHPRDVTPEEFISTLREIFVPNFRGTASHNPQMPIRRQIIDKETRIRIDIDDNEFADLHCKRGKEEHFIRVFHIKGFPRQINLWKFSNIIFPYDQPQKEKFPYQFGIIMSVRIRDRERRKQELEKKAQWNIHQTDNNPLAKFFPKLKEKRMYAEYVLELINENKLPLEGVLTFFTMAPDKESLDFYSNDIIQAFTSEGFEVTREIGSSIVPTLLEYLPLNHIEERREFLKKDSTLFDANIASLIPFIGAVYGTKTPATIYLDRKFNISFYDLFDSKTNYNAVKVATSGGGKSFSEGDFHVQHLSMGRVIRVIDIGWSYKTLCEAIGGEYIELSEDKKPCFNPFTNVITDESGNIHEDEMESLVPLIGILAGIDVSYQIATEQDNVFARFASAITMAISQAWKKHGRKMGVKEVADELKNMEDTTGERIPQKLYEALKPFAYEPNKARYFNGTNNINYSLDYVVLEMEQVEQKDVRLKGAILLSLIQKILNEFFLAEIKGDRRKKILVIDEAWSLLADMAAAKFMEAAARRFRKYGCSLVVITQGIDDLFKSPTTQAIYANAAHLILLRQKPEILQKVLEEKKLVLSEFAEEIVSSLHTRPGKYSELYIKSDDLEGAVRLVVDKFSYWMFTTHPDDKKKREKLMKKYNLSLFEASRILAKRERIGELLVKAGKITPTQLKYALEIKEKYPAKKIGEILIEMGATTKEVIDEVLEK